MGLHIRGYIYVAIYVAVSRGCPKANFKTSQSAKPKSVKPVRPAMLASQASQVSRANVFMLKFLS